MKRFILIPLLFCTLFAYSQTKLFEWDANKGSNLDQVSKTAGNNTAVLYKQTEKGLAGRFNGSTSLINYGSGHDWDGNITIEAWMKLYSYGEGNDGRIFEFQTSGVRLYTRGASRHLRLYSDGTTLTNSAASITDFNKWYHIIITRTDAGITNFYVDTVISGSANQAGGTPISNGNLFVGNDNTSVRTFDGDITKLIIYNSILTTTERNNKYAEFQSSWNRFETKSKFIYPTAAVTNAFYQNTFKWEGVGNKPFGIKINSGTFLVGESESAVLDLPAGFNYLNCSGNGSFQINLNSIDLVKDATIYYYNGSIWTKNVDVLGALVGDNTWLSLIGKSLRFTLTTNDAITGIRIADSALSTTYTLFPIFDWDARDSTFIEKITKTTGTDVAIVFANTSKGVAAKYDGSTSILNFGDVLDLTGNKTFEAWIRPFGWGEGNDGRILEDTQARWQLRYGGGSDQNTRFYSENSTITKSANNSIVLNTWHHLLVKRESDGTTNFYVNGSLSGIADQAGGTPVDGTNMYIGNFTSAIRTFDGYIARFAIYGDTLDAADISTLYSAFLDESTITSPVSYKVVNDNAGATKLGNTGLSYDLVRDYLIVGEFGKDGDTSRVLIRNLNNDMIDSIDFTTYLDYIQGVAYDQDTMYYAWGIEKDSAFETTNSWVVGISANKNKTFEKLLPPYMGNPNSSLFCEGDSILWFRPNTGYVRRIRISPWTVTDSIVTPIPGEGLWRNDDGTFWLGDDTNITKYDATLTTILDQFAHGTSGQEGLIFKNNVIWRNDDEWYHGNVVNGNRCFRYNLNYY